MKGALLKEFGQPLSIEEIADPESRAGEVVVRVLATPVLSYTNEVFSGERPYPLLLPLVPGCGAIGRVEKIGPDATRIKVGEMVFCDPTVRSRDDSLTPDIMLQGWIAPSEGAKKLQAYFRNGPFAEQMLLPLENVVSLENLSGFDPAQLTPLGTLLVPYGGLLRAGFEAGQTLVVNGASGHFGSAAVAVALAMGAAQVIALGRNEQKLAKLATTLGKRVQTVKLVENEAANLKQILEVAKSPIDCVVDLLSPTPDSSSTRQAILTLRPGGTAVLMGGVRVDLQLPYNHIMRNNLIIRGSYMCPRYAPAQLAKLVQAGLLDLNLFTVKDFPLEQIEQAIGYAKEHGGAFEMTALKP